MIPPFIDLGKDLYFKELDAEKLTHTYYHAIVTFTIVLMMVYEYTFDATVEEQYGVRGFWFNYIMHFWSAWLQDLHVPQNCYVHHGHMN